MKISDHSSKKDSNRISEEERRIAGFPQIVMMNLAMIVAGCASGWNQSLHIGVGEFLVSLALCTLAFVCLALCVAEMAGIIAFSGGSFGYVRCTLSPLVGYYCGICDLLQTVFYTAIFVRVVSTALAIAAGDENYTDHLPAWYLAVYAVIILIALPGGRWFWNSTAVFALFSIVALLIYCLMNVNHVDFDKFSTRSVSAFAGSAEDFFGALQVPMLYFVGTDLITLFGEEVKEPQKNIPWSIVISLGVTMFLGWWVTLTVVSVQPGVSEEMLSKDAIFPMHFSFEEVFHLSNQASNLLMAPITFSSALGFMFAAGRQMYSMSKSGLLPAFLSKTFGDRKVPVAAMLTVAALGFTVQTILWKAMPASDDLFDLCMGNACMVYVCMLACFVMFRVKYGSMDRTFVNPLGIPSAIFGLTYFSVMMGSKLFGQLDFNAFVVWCVVIFVAMVYYFKVAEARQFFSKDEQKKFMKAYILNANRRKKHKTSGMMKALMAFIHYIGLEKLFTEMPSHLKNLSGTHSPRGGNPHSSSNAHSPRSSSPRSPRSKIAPSADVDFEPTAVDPTPGLIPNLGLRIDTGTVHRDEGISLDVPAYTNSDERMLESNDVAVTHSMRRASLRGNNKVLPIDESEEGTQAVSWPGKLLDESESRKFFEMVNLLDDEVVDLSRELPNKFVPVSHFFGSGKGHTHVKVKVGDKNEVSANDRDVSSARDRGSKSDQNCLLRAVSFDELKSDYVRSAEFV